MTFSTLVKILKVEDALDDKLTCFLTSFLFSKVVFLLHFDRVVELL